ncbi:aldo/keto reductase [Microbacterium sp. STN6]|uniref:aldo/keto reductase n=1 Tax=Microbacterium sp. STN6 TaxID=2995588 RepID=UPI002260DA4A|nr:aldo/keto reductase [Microbacterium sp. STN6]MCX7521738.1 aldo/keto reductase [Microbacterium sp. STN6]
MPSSNIVPTVTLNSGAEIPQLGFGVFRVDADEARRVVTDALEVGYRHIDTAAVYGNEQQVGEAIAASGVPRDELFITTKLWNDRQQSAEAAFDESLERLGLDYVDLYLIHWPAPKRDTYVEAWRSLEKIAESGRARSIGVSNFEREHLQRLFDETSIVPAVDQIELHPAFQQRDVTSFAREHGINIEAWGPLGQGKYNLLELPEVTSAAEAHGKTAAQVVIRWHLQSGNIIFPKSTHRERMAENFDVFDFELSRAELDAITALERGGRVASSPADVN